MTTGDDMNIHQTLKAETVPWRHPWISEIPCNAISKRPTLHKGDAFMSLEESEDIQLPPYAPI
jgi:hypothetical protein